MSLIHEALKKVERQRQLGKAPTLDSPRFRRRRRRWPWVFVVLLALGATAAWTWRVPLVHKARSVAARVMGSGVAAGPAATRETRTPPPTVPAHAAERQNRAPGYRRLPGNRRTRLWQRPRRKSKRRAENPRRSPRPVRRHRSRQRSLLRIPGKVRQAARRGMLRRLAGESRQL